MLCEKEENDDIIMVIKIIIIIIARQTKKVPDKNPRNNRVKIMICCYVRVARTSVLIEAKDGAT